MKAIHVPTVDARYWAAILCASVFGTNLGDLYAHGSGLGIGPGLLVLALLAAAAFAAERVDVGVRELWYWLVIIVVRTGATNIADWLAFRVRVPQGALIGGLALLVAGFGRASARGTAADDDPDLPLMRTGAAYWAAMLSAGVFGTVLGDVCSHAIGQLSASLVLLAALAAALTVRARGGLPVVLTYWLAIAAARTAGTSLGDWLAEDDLLAIGLPIATALSGSAFVLVLALVPSAGRRPAGRG